MSFLSARNIRFALAIAGFAGAVFAPPSVPLLIMVLLALRYRALEVLAIGVLVDLLWLPAPSLHTLPLFTIAGLALLWGFEPLRAEFLAQQGI